MARISSRKYKGAVRLGRSGGTPSRATLTTALAGSNNDLTLTAQGFGTGTNSLRFRIVVAGNSTVLSVVVAGNDITVNSATNGGGTATSTAAQVKAALDASAAVTLVNTALAAGNDGTGVVVALGYTSLAGGAAFVAGR